MLEGRRMLLMPKKSEKHTPVVISECCASADNWLRFKVMCDLTLIHNSTRELHTGVNKDKPKAEKLWLLDWLWKLVVVLQMKRSTCIFAGRHWHTSTGTGIWAKGVWGCISTPLAFVTSPSWHTLSARDLCVLFFFPQLCVCVVRTPGFLNYSGQLRWAWGSSSVFKANFSTILMLVCILHHCLFCIWHWGTT